MDVPAGQLSRNDQIVRGTTCCVSKCEDLQIQAVRCASSDCCNEESCEQEQLPSLHHEDIVNTMDKNSNFENLPLEKTCQALSCTAEIEVESSRKGSLCKDRCCDTDTDPPDQVTVDQCCPNAACDESVGSSGNFISKGNTKPCCDSSCLDRLAFRECQDVCSPATRTSSQDANTACSLHKSKVRERYGTKLAALECICRALIALGQKSCCAPKNQNSRRSPLRSKKSSRPSDASLGGSHPITPAPGELKDTCNSKELDLPLQSVACKSKCCKSVKEPPVAPSDDAASASGVPSCTKGKCTIAADNEVFASSSSVEKAVSHKEHMMLSVTGMTCTGCETKLQRVLRSLRAVSNLTTSLILARADFDIDVAVMCIENVIKHLQRTTSFRCERMMAQGGSVDIVPEGDMAQFLSQPLLRGAKSMTATAKDVVRVNFDPKIVGARTLIESTFQIGCRLAPLKVPHELRASRKHVRHMGYSTVLSAIFTIPVLVLAWAPLVPRPIPYGAVSLVLATLVQVLIAGPFYPKALQSLLFSRTIELDLLIVLSTSAAYVFSVVSFVYLACGHPLSTGEFFETSTLLVTLIMVGQWLSALARQKAVESISIRSLQSSNAQLLTAAGEHVAEIDTKLLQYGDVFGVSPETTIPTDGIVITGSSEADESMLTGESRPVEKQPGSLVIAGSINISGKLIVRLTRLPVENTISTIASMVDNAKLTKPKVQDLADRVASYFVPVVLLLAIMTLVIWIAIGVTVRNQTGSEATIQAITYAITVLIVSCPCAIGLAVPMVIVISSGIAAKHGVVFKSAESLEIAYKATHIVFDKTGTLTEGRLSVIEEHYMVEDEAGTRAMIRSLAKNSKHPVSAAVAAHIGAVKGISAPVGDIKAFPRLGVEGKIHGRQIRAGSASWLGFTLDPQVQILLGKGLTLYCVVIETRLCAVFGLADTIRADSAALVAKLYERGLRVMLLSGDEEGAVRKVATQLAPYPFEALSRCPPGDKQNHIQRLLSTPVSNNKRPVVIFVGDGTNDAAALAQASIGVHMASGTDVAQSAADVILMRPSLQGVLTMIDISRAAMLRVKINFGWSLIYNILALLFASGALVNATNGGTIRLPPAYAGLGELVNVMPVIAIALGLRWVRF